MRAIDLAYESYLDTSTVASAFLPATQKAGTKCASMRKCVHACVYAYSQAIAPLSADRAVSPMRGGVSQSQQLATEIVQQLPKASIAALIASLTLAQVNPAAAAEFYQPPASGNTATQQVCSPSTCPPMLPARSLHLYTSSVSALTSDVTALHCLRGGRLRSSTLMPKQMLLHRAFMRA